MEDKREIWRIEIGKDQLIGIESNKYRDKCQYRSKIKIKGEVEKCIGNKGNLSEEGSNL